MNDMSDRDNGIGESSRVAPRLPRAVAGAQASVRPRTIDRRDVAGEGRIRVIAKAVRAVDSTICAADHAMWAAEKAIAVTKSCTFPADDPYAQGFFIEQAPP